MLLKRLVTDATVYAVANAVQKLGPFVVIPLVTTRLGSDAFKVYDVSFVWAYLFSWLVVLGQDVAASLLYFDERETAFGKQQVVAASLFVQVGFLLFVALLFWTSAGFLPQALFAKEPAIARWWPVALLILPGHIAYYHALNVLLWQRKKAAYVWLCLVQTAAIIGSVFVSLVLLKGGIADLFYSLVGSVSLSGLAGLFYIRRELFAGLRPLQPALYKKLLALGVPFALTAFSQQLIPAIDRFFLVQFHYGPQLASYALASKLGTLVSFGGSAFVLAFTPYALARLHTENAEADISALFRTVAVTGFLAVPVLLLFKDLLVGLFADATYATAANLLPFFFFGWVFDAFGYFTLLAVYRSQKTYLSLGLFAAGLVFIALLNLFLIPVLGLYGAALSFGLCKAMVFFLSLFWFKKYFHLRLRARSFLTAFFAAVSCSYLIYVLPLWANLLLCLGLFAVILGVARKNNRLHAA